MRVSISEFDVYRRHILTSKVDPRAVRVSIRWYPLSERSDVHFTGACQIQQHLPVLMSGDKVKYHQ